MEFLKKLSSIYQWIFVEMRDPRSDRYPLTKDPFITILICCFYVYLVKVAGPRYMEHRPPYRLKWIMFLYNLLQTLFSCWMFYESCSIGWLNGGYNWSCQPVDYSESANAIRTTNLAWWYYFSKFTEFFDTFFFVARKKMKHVSTLHVVHHAIMPFSVWWGVKFVPGGHSTFFGFLNTFVHIFMYFYYMIAALGPAYSHLLWWKKYLTILQIIQFLGIITHELQLLFIECDYPKITAWYILGHGVLFLILFYDFFSKEYNGKKVQHSFNHDGKQCNGGPSTRVGGEKNHLVGSENRDFEERVVRRKLLDSLRNGQSSEFS